MKKYITIIVLTLISMGAKAQFSINYSAGYGSYQMTDMKELGKSVFQGLKGELPPEAKMIDNFPGYVTQNIDVSYKLNKHEIGLKGSYLTTGSKVAYSDYSGSIQSRIIVDGYRLGLMYRFYFLEHEINNNMAFSLFAELSPGITLSKIKYKVKGRLTDFPEEDMNTSINELEKSSSGFTVQPLVGAKFNFTRNIFALVSAGFDFEFGNTPYKGKSNYGITYERRVEWSGFRANAGVGYTF